MLTVLEQPSGRLVDLNAPLTLAEYLNLPDDTRLEIVRAYVNAGIFGPGDRIKSVVLGWVDIPVAQLASPR